MTTGDWVSIVIFVVVIMGLLAFWPDGRKIPMAKVHFRASIHTEVLCGCRSSHGTIWIDQHWSRITCKNCLKHKTKKQPAPIVGAKER